MRRTLTAFAALAAIGTLASAEPTQSSCFFTHQSWNWKAAPDAQAIYIKVFPNRYYRLDLSARCPSLLWPDAHLVTVHHSTSVCNALDWDIKVKQSTGGIAVPCIVKKMTQLSAAEAAQIPEKSRPQ